MSAPSLNPPSGSSRLPTFPAVPTPGAGLTFARWVSIVFHPFVTLCLLVSVGSARVGSAHSSIRLTLLVVLCVMVPVTLLTLRQRRRGLWADIDASHKKNRPLLYAVSIVALAGLCLYLRATGASPIVLRGFVLTVAMFVLSGLITPWLKVSLHLACAALTASTLVTLASPVGYGLAAVVPLIAWSRVRLARHTWLEVLAGALIGAVTGLAINVA